MEIHAVNRSRTQHSSGPVRARLGRAPLAAGILFLVAGLPSAALAQDTEKNPSAPPTTPEEIAKAKALKEANAAAKGAGGQPGTAASQAPATRPGTGATGTATGPAGGTQPRTSGTQVPGLRVEPPAATGRGGAGATGAQQPLAPDEVTLSAFADAVDLKTLVEYVAETLGINIAGNDTLTGAVVLNAPVVVKRENLLKLLDSLLEQQGFTIVSDPTGWYKVVPADGVVFNPGQNDLTTTRVIPTPTVKPSSIADAITTQLGIQGKPQRISYVDDLGVIIATDTPRRLDGIAELIKQILARSQETEFLRFDLEHVAAMTARQRVIELLGTPTTPVIGGAQQNQANAAVNAALGTLTNLADRLIVDAAGNALIFRGFPAEAARVQAILAIVDRPNTLRYEQYYAGTAAQQIAELAHRLGLGNVETVDTGSSPTSTTGTPVIPQQQNRQNQASLQAQAQQNTGGPVMIVDTFRNDIIYYGTESQHAQLRDLIAKFDTKSEQVVIVTYKIKNKPATDVADVLNGIAFNQATSDTSSGFLPGAGRTPGGGFFINPFNQQQNQNTTNRNSSQNRNTNNRQGNTGNTGFRFQPTGAQSGAAADGTDPVGGDNVFILADTPNNQVIVKAPARQQEEFAKLIGKLDQRSPQVFIEVQIVAVSSTDDFRLAFETQIIAGQFNWNTNFGLGSLTSTTPGTGTNPGTTTGDFSSQKNVATSLAGLTAAVIKSQYVPIVMTALKRDADTRILATPQLLVDDNVEAEIVSLDEQPTSTSSQTNSSTINSFGGYEQAGTRLTVTPSISDGGYLRLQYEIELSNFVGTGSNGFPPPKQTRNVRSDSVTVPGDATIIVGGITIDQKSNNIAKVPLLGDVPIFGQLFRDTQKANTSGRLYVFITPRIFRDPTFRDPILATLGPRIEAGLASDYPELAPVMIDQIDPLNTMPGRKSAIPPPPPAVKNEEAKP